MSSGYLSELLSGRQPMLTRSLAWIVVLSFCTALHGMAQVSTANVTAVIEDTTGARISDAGITLTNTLTGAESTCKSNAQGLFALPGLLPGSYSLAIERVGFSTVQFTGLALNVGDNKRFLIRMRVGTVTETVTIDASGVSPNSADASVSTVVDHTFVANVPLNGRSFQDLISMTPGVATDSPQVSAAGYGPQGDFSVNGQRPDRNSYMIDGVSADLGVGLSIGHQKFASAGTAAATTALGTTQSLISIDGLQEFRVMTSNSSAEFGRGTGGQFALLTRSGTDKNHGSLYNYVRHSYVDAEDWYLRYYDARNKFPYQQLDFGGAVGGPINIPAINHRGAKTFFFLSYEGILVKNPIAPSILFKPTHEQVINAPAALSNLLQAFSVNNAFGIGMTLPASTGMSAAINMANPRPGALNSSSARLDHIFSPRLSAFVRFQTTPSRDVSNLGYYVASRYLDLKTATLGLTQRLTPVMVNDFRLGYGWSASRFNATQENLSGYPQWDNFNLNMGVPDSVGNSASLFLHAAGAGDAELKTDGASGNLKQWNVRDTLFVQKSRHLLQFGVDERHFVAMVRPSEMMVEADFFSPQAVLANSASVLSITRTLPASPRFEQFAAFVQDEWKASKTLTISAGLRWDVAPAPHGSHGADAYAVLGNIASPSTLTLAPRGTSLWNTGWLNIAPRVGVTWLANSTSGHELVVRAGGGIHFGSSNRAAIPAFSALGFSTTHQYTNVPVPVTIAQLDVSPSAVAPYTHSLVYNFPRSFSLPYVVQWNFALEQAIGKSQTITASYIGSNGRRLQQERRIDISAKNPVFGEVVYFSPSSTSSYEALQLKFQRTMTHGVQALTSYTWSHTLDYGSPDPAWPLTHASSDYDLRHHFEAAISWSQPEYSCSEICKLLFTHWGVDARLTARSGFPITPIGNILSDSATGNRYFSGVNLIPGKPIYLYGAQYPGGRAINGGPYATDPAFALPTVSDPGNAPRNILRGFGNNQVNLAVRHDIHLYGNVGLQLRAESYNILNHPVLGYVDTPITNALFGRATMMLNQSFGPTGSLYQPGGPRSMQLSLRLHF